MGSVGLEFLRVLDSLVCCLKGLRVVGSFWCVCFIKFSDSKFSRIQGTIFRSQLMFLVHSRIWRLGIGTEVFRVVVLVGLCC